MMPLEPHDYASTIVKSWESRGFRHRLVIQSNAGWSDEKDRIKYAIADGKKTSLQHLWSSESNRGFLLKMQEYLI